MLIVPFGDIMFAGIEAQVEHGVDRVKVLFQFAFCRRWYDLNAAMLRQRNRHDGAENPVFVNGFDWLHDSPADLASIVAIKL
jgi:hypothetical protein